MIYMENVGRVLVLSTSVPQYFNDTTGALVNITNGLTGYGAFVYVNSLNWCYSRNSTQYSTSTDGITWTTPATLLGDPGNAVSSLVSGNGKYVSATGSAPFVMQTSTDGITWVNRGGSKAVYCLIYTLLEPL